VSRSTIAIIWIAGLILAALLYSIGPDRFVSACLNILDTIDYTLHNLAFALGARTYAVVRALAIALYVVFVILAFLSSQQGRGGFGSIFVVTVLLLILVWRPFDSDPAPIARWLLALILTLFGAITMTQRLIVQPRQNPPPPPYPPGRLP
jgi:hypothetical protein